MNRETTRLKALPKYIRDFLDGLDDKTWTDVASAMHGGRISDGMTTKQSDLFKRLSKHIPDLKDISNEFDFKSDKLKMYIDCKSQDHNNNIKPMDVAQKYIRANIEGYKMYFVMPHEDTGSWPINKYKEHGINIMTEKDFVEKLYG